MATSIYEALKEMVGEKNIPMEVLIKAISDALVVAYRKNFKTNEDIKVILDDETGTFRVIATKVVVYKKDLKNKDKEFPYEEAVEFSPDIKVGETIEEDVTPPTFGRIAAQTAKQVVTQKIKEAERTFVIKEFQEKVGTLIVGKVQRLEKGNIFVDLGKAEGILPSKEQVPGEVYRVNDRIKSLILEVKSSTKEPEIILSRSNHKFVEKLFEEVVPEIKDGTVVIKSIAREPGYRTKIAVFTNNPKVDPVGSCVGLRGSRIKGILEELNGEKIDIVRYSNNLAEFVTNALSPAKVDSVTIQTQGTTNVAQVLVAPDQLSLAIGKDGQNVKLASKLTNTKIDIKTSSNQAQNQDKDSKK